MKMDSIEVADIDLETLPFVQQLLWERNRTLYDYTEWKYGKNSPKGFRGVIALKGEEPVGCFGLMPKALRSGEGQIPCGWFADWYVTPSMRGSGLGTRLLKEIAQRGYPLFFGHPGPQKASQICLQNGWKPVPFQSSRRLVISPYSYFGRRTRYSVKRLLMVIQYYSKTAMAGLYKHHFHETYFQKEVDGFVNLDLDWHRYQPVNPKIARTYGDWKGSKASISYCDDVFPSGETRRRVLQIENLHEYPQDIFSFFAEVKKSAINYVDIFTSDKSTDSILAKAGAIKFKESPIVWYGKDYRPQNILIQGIDRENWLYLAGDV